MVKYNSVVPGSQSKELPGSPCLIPAGVIGFGGNGENAGTICQPTRPGLLASYQGSGRQLINIELQTRVRTQTKPYLIDKWLFYWLFGRR